MVIPFLVAVLVLVVVGTLLWKVMAAQAAQAGHDGAPGGSAEDAPTGPTRAASPRRPQRRPVAPDDDPEFLRQLERRRKEQESEEQLNRWEEELGRAQGEGRGDDDAGSGTDGTDGTDRRP